MRKTLRGFFIFLMVSGLSGCVIEQPEPEPEPEPVFEYEFFDDTPLHFDLDGRLYYVVGFRNIGSVYIEYVEVKCTFVYAGLDDVFRVGTNSEIAPGAHTVWLFLGFGSTYDWVWPDNVILEVTYIR